MTIRFKTPPVFTKQLFLQHANNLPDLEDVIQGPAHHVVVGGSNPEHRREKSTVALARDIACPLVTKEISTTILNPNRRQFINKPSTTDSIQHRDRVRK